MNRRAAKEVELQAQPLQDLYDAAEEDEAIENVYQANEYLPGPAGVEEDDWAE